MKPLFEEISFTPEALTRAIIQGEATEDEIFELIKNLDMFSQDWNFTIRLARHFCNQLAEVSTFLVKECGKDLEFINLEKL